jgi:hypothetical protein
MEEIAKLTDALDRVLTFKTRENKWLEVIPGKYPW